MGQAGPQILVDRQLHAIALGDVLGESGKLLRRERQQRLSGQQMKTVAIFATPHLRFGVTVVVLSSISY